MIQVNIWRPERNQEVLVFEVKDIPGVGVNSDTVYHGYNIFLPMDIRFTLDDVKSNHYTACVIADHQVLVTLPGWPYSFLHCRGDMKLKKNLVNSMDDACHDYKDNKAARLLKHIVLKFPKGHVLSSKDIYAKATDDEKLCMELVSIPGKHLALPTLDNTRHYALWKVARADIRPAKRGKIEEEEPLSEVAALLAAMMGNPKEDKDYQYGTMDNEDQNS